MKSWPTILIRARQIMAQYDTPVTLRQIFYRLVSEQLIPNNRSSGPELWLGSSSSRWSNRHHRAPGTRGCVGAYELWRLWC